MKKLLTIIGVAALTLATVNLSAQTNEAPWWKNIVGFSQSVSDSKEITLTVYPSYAPNLTLDNGRKAPWGFGAAAMYPLGTDHLLVGGRIDYLADRLWAPSLTITPNVDVQLFGKNFTVFGIGGTVMPIAGAQSDNKDVGGVFGAGIYTTVWKPTEKTGLSLWGAYERWTPVLDTTILHFSAAFTIKF